MTRRLTILITSLVLAMAVGVPAAFSWCNGPAVDGKGGFGYGTHDWILEHAIRQAGVEGQWVQVSTALWHTNDPDYYDYNVAWHLYRERGLSLGGPQRIADYYYMAAKALRAGDKRSASVYLGVMAHYYGDILQPYHTTWDAISHPTQHREYEFAVDEYHRNYDSAPFWINPAPAQPITDVRERAISAAKLARSQYPALVAEMVQHPGADAHRNSTIDGITELVLTRAVNDMADVVRTLSVNSDPARTASTISTSPALGTSLPPARMTSKMSNPRPHRGRKVGVFTTCYDANGKLLEGVGVAFYWPKPGGGTVKVMSWSNSQGVAHNWRVVSKRFKVGKKYYVTTRSTSSGVSRTIRTSFRPKP